MILVTVGTGSGGFNRLVRPADQLAEVLEEEVLIQYGNSSYIPCHANSFPFTGSEEMSNLTIQARVIVTHAAAGTIIMAFKNQKRLVLVPRLQRYGEAVDDHQLQLANALHSQGRAVTVIGPTIFTLAQAIYRAKYLNFSTTEASELTMAVQACLARWEDEKTQ